MDVLTLWLKSNSLFWNSYNSFPNKIFYNFHNYWMTPPPKKKTNKQQNPYIFDWNSYDVYVMIYRRSCIWPILFKVLTLNVAICIVRLHFSNFCFSLSSIADFLNTGTRAPTSAERAPFFTLAKSDVVWTGGLSMGHGNLSMAVFILIYRSHYYRWAAVVPRSNYLILTVEPLDSYAQGLVRHSVEPSEGFSARLYVHHAASHGFQKYFSSPFCLY